MTKLLMISLVILLIAPNIKGQSKLSFQLIKQSVITQDEFINRMLQNDFILTSVNGQEKVFMQRDDINTGQVNSGMAFKIYNENHVSFAFTPLGRSLYLELMKEIKENTIPGKMKYFDSIENYAQGYTSKGNNQLLFFTYSENDGTFVSDIIEVFLNK